MDGSYLSLFPSAVVICELDHPIFTVYTHYLQTDRIMAATQTIQVPHLGGTKAGYAFAREYDASKPTCVLVNSMCMTSSLFKVQFENEELTNAMNLLAIEPLGHGATSCPSEHFTYWDSANMAIQVLDAFGIKKAFALGTSQGGWIVARMALLAPERVILLNPFGW